MPVFPGELGRVFFPSFADPIQSASASQHNWQVVYVAYPYLAVHVLNSERNAKLGILFDATDWPHRPPRAIPCTPDFTKRLASKEVAPFLLREGGENHVWDDAKRPGQGAYFCVEGTREFHEDYGDALSWESVRHLPNFGPVGIVNNVVSLLKRD